MQTNIKFLTIKFQYPGSYGYGRVSKVKRSSWDFFKVVHFLPGGCCGSAPGSPRSYSSNNLHHWSQNHLKSSLSTAERSSSFQTSTSLPLPSCDINFFWQLVSLITFRWRPRARDLWGWFERGATDWCIKELPSRLRSLFARTVWCCWPWTFLLVSLFLHLVERKICASKEFTTPAKRRRNQQLMDWKIILKPADDLSHHQHQFGVKQLNKYEQDRRAERFAKII